MKRSTSPLGQETSPTAGTDRRSSGLSTHKSAGDAAPPDVDSSALLAAGVCDAALRGSGAPIATQRRKLAITSAGNLPSGGIS
jgi:hypothetical protein